MYTDIIVNLLSAFLVICITFFFLFIYYNHIYEKDNKGKVSFSLFLRGFLNKFLLDKIELAIFDVKTKDDGKNLEEKTEIYAIPISKIQNSDSVMYRSSKNYGEDDTYSVRTWFGVNYTKLIKEKPQYICFNVKGIEKIYFSTEEFLNLINSEITDSEQEKYISRNSFDTYLMKSKEDNNWYITRLGSNLINPIVIKKEA